MNRLMNDNDLIQGIRAGERWACEALLGEHGPRMHAVAARFFRCEHDRDDAVQEAFICALRGIHGFDEQAALGTWLHRITVNACLMRLRSRGRRPELSINEKLPSFDEAGRAGRRCQLWDEDPHTTLAANETRAQVRDCIDRLPDSYRAVLLLRDIEELNTLETAERLHTSAANVKTRLHRARQSLRTLLEPEFAM